MSSQEVADQWMEETKDMTGIQLDISVSSQMSSMMSTGSGALVTLSSTNLDDLKEAVAQVEEQAWNIPGVLNVSSDAGESATQIKVLIATCILHIWQIMRKCLKMITICPCLPMLKPKIPERKLIL